MFPVLQIGPLAIQTPGLFLLASLWVGLSLAERTCQQRGLTADQLYNLAFSMMFSGLLGARLGYVIQFPSAFSASPLSVLSLDASLLDPFAGMAFAVLGGFIYGNRQGFRLRESLDAVTPALATLVAGIGLANLASGAGYGSETSLPWAIEIAGALRHPSQVYETLAAAGILALILLQASHPALPKGHRFLIFVALTSASILFLEAFRGDSTLLPGGLRANQVFAWLILASSLYSLNTTSRQPHMTPEPESKQQTD